MSKTTIATANLLPDWPTDTSSADGAQGDLVYDQDSLIYEITKQQTPATSSVDNYANRRATVVDKTNPIFPLSFLDGLRPTVNEATFTSLQEWEGYVVEVTGETFTARLLDLTNNGAHEEEEADFPIDEISDTDRGILQPGAIFRWSIGYRRTGGGAKERVSRIVFRQLPAWTRRELQENRHKAKTLAAALREE